MFCREWKVLHPFESPGWWKEQVLSWKWGQWVSPAVSLWKVKGPGVCRQCCKVRGLAEGRASGTSCCLDLGIPAWAFRVSRVSQAPAKLKELFPAERPLTYHDCPRVKVLKVSFVLCWAPPCSEMLPRDGFGSAGPELTAALGVFLQRLWGSLLRGLPRAWFCG